MGGGAGYLYLYCVCGALVLCLFGMGAALVWWGRRKEKKRAALRAPRGDASEA